MEEGKETVGEMPPTVKPAPVDLGPLRREPGLLRKEKGRRRGWKQTLLTVKLKEWV
jgi:hypothetical protein